VFPLFFQLVFYICMRWLCAWCQFYTNKNSILQVTILADTKAFTDVKAKQKTKSMKRSNLTISLNATESEAWSSHSVHLLVFDLLYFQKSLQVFRVIVLEINNPASTCQYTFLNCKVHSLVPDTSKQFSVKNKYASKY